MILTPDAFILSLCSRYENISSMITLGRLSQQGPLSCCAIVICNLNVNCPRLLTALLVKLSSEVNNNLIFR